MKKRPLVALCVLRFGGSTVYDMRWPAVRWPRSDGGRWCVRDRAGNDRYARTFIGAMVLVFRHRKAKA